jgi:hypothetical protein
MSNLDRCNRCGLQRGAHGLDWSCPTGPPGGARTGLLIVGTVLAVAGAILWGVAGSAPSGLNTLAAIAFPGGLILLIATLMRPGRSRPPADREDEPMGTGVDRIPPWSRPSLAGPAIRVRTG